MNVNILDPGLVNKFGHHFDLDVKIAKQLNVDGNTVRLYCHQNISAECIQILSEYCQVVPLFSINAYGRAHYSDPLAGAFVEFNHHTQVLAEEISTIAEADQTIFPSLFAAQLNACAQVPSIKNVSGCIHGLADHQRELNLIHWRYSLLRCLSRKINLKIGVVEPELAIECQKFAANDLKIRHFPIPYDGSEKESDNPRLTKIGFFGHQRNEKGAAMIWQIARKLADQNFSIIIQDCTETFSKINHNNINVIPYVENIATEMAKCDGIILPYDAENYKQRGSGILWDALASGIPVVVPFDTSLSRWVDKFDFGVQYYEKNVRSIIHAVNEMDSNYLHYLTNAKVASEQWKKSHGLAKFARALI